MQVQGPPVLGYSPYGETAVWRGPSVNRSCALTTMCIAMCSNITQCVLCALLLHNVYYIYALLLHNHVH